MLYWAEGAKGRNTVEFSNSDVAMVVLFSRFLRISLGVPATRLTVRVNAYTDNGVSIDAIQAHWLSALDLPASCLRRPVVDHRPTSSSGVAKNRLVHGVCSLRTHSTEAAQHIYGAIQEYGGFEEPRWLG